MNDEGTMGQSEKEGFFMKIVSLIFQPKIFLTLITGLVVPVSIQIVVNNIEETKIKQQMVTTIMEIIEKGIDLHDESDLDKLYILTTLVSDNDFGLKFPSAKVIIGERKQIEKDGLLEEIEQLNLDRENIMEEVVKGNEEVQQIKRDYEDEREKNIASILALEANDANLESAISILEDDNNNLQMENNSLRNRNAGVLQEVEKLKNNIVKNIISLVKDEPYEINGIIVDVEYINGLVKSLNIRLTDKQSGQSVKETSIGFNSGIAAKLGGYIYVIYVNDYIDRVNVNAVFYKFRFDV